MGKRKKTNRETQNVARLDRVMARMVIDMRKNKDSTLNPKESALILKILAYALRKMKEDLEKGIEDE